MLLELLPQRLAVMRLDPGNPVPDWATKGTFFSITYTQDELSIFCDSSVMPDEAGKIDGWRAIRVAGQLDLQLVGIISQLSVPLAAKQIPVFSISTHDTDYMLIREDQTEDAIEVLRGAGHKVVRTQAS
jgi:hypothetical protein